MDVLMVYPSTAWLKVTYGGKTGYVLSRYVAIEGDETYRAGTVTAASSLNVRGGAGTGHAVVGLLKRNDTAVIVSSVKSGGSTWYRILYGGQYGYVSANYMRRQGS
jgi:D-alanyl-D-alanine carboxypeptidase